SARPPPHRSLPSFPTRRSSDLALAEDEPEPRVALADAREDHADADLVHLHRRDDRPRADDRRVADALHLVPHRRAAALEDVERDDEARVLRGSPEGLPHLMPHGHRRAPRDDPGAMQAEARAG